MDAIEQLRAEVAQLELTNQKQNAEIQKREALLEGLRQELDETNRGVVALYAEIENYSEQLKQASDLKSRFLTYMSHEFRTPLGSMQSIARILLNRLDGDLTQEQEKQVKFIDKAAVELTDMVNDLLDLSKVEAGRVTIAPEWFEMVDLFSAIRGLFKPIVANTSVALIFDEPPEGFRLFTDDTKLSIILRNLISNALKFTSQGEVRISALVVSEENVSFRVRDSGIGISPENLPSIFDDWIQINSKTQKRLRGSGLGLSICKRYAELLGGDVSVESELGVGSVFTLTIPRILPNPVVESASMESAESVGRPQ